MLNVGIDRTGDVGNLKTCRSQFKPHAIRNSTYFAYQILIYGNIFKEKKHLSILKLTKSIFIIKSKKRYVGIINQNANIKKIIRTIFW